MTARVRITVHHDCGHSEIFMDRIEEKYPFRYCGECQDELDPTGKYPWRLDTEVVDEPGRWQETTSGRVFVPEAAR